MLATYAQIFPPIANQYYLNRYTNRRSYRSCKAGLTLWPRQYLTMCEHHIMLYRKCDHDFHAMKTCSDVAKGKDCKDPPEHKLPIYSFCDDGENLYDNWCTSCAPQIVQVLDRLAKHNFQGKILEKLAAAEVRRQNPGNISGLQLIGLGAHNGSCMCCRMMSDS